jgi:hypothetical protein
VSEALPPAAQRVGQLLLQDFEANGVHLQGDAQARFLAASAREQMLCMQFGASPHTLRWIHLPSRAGLHLGSGTLPLTSNSGHHLWSLQTVGLGAGHNMGDPSKYGRIAVPIKTRGGALDALPPNARVAARREGKLLRVPTHEQLLPELLTHLPDHTLRRQVAPAA